MKADDTTVAEVMKVLEGFAQAYVNQSKEDLKELIHPDIVLIGTEEADRRVGWKEIVDQINIDWNKSKYISIEFGWKTVSVHDSLALVATERITRKNINGKETTVKSRLTAVLKKQGDKWFILQWHNSVPV